MENEVKHFTVTIATKGLPELTVEEIRAELDYYCYLGAKAYSNAAIQLILAHRRERLAREKEQGL